MAKTITIELNANSISKAIKEVAEYKTWVIAKEKELVARLAELGSVIATDNFSSALYAGNNDVVVTMNTTNTGAEIIANGQAVAFIEFGSGVLEGNGYLGTKPADVSAIGTYGDQKGSNPKGWVYKGEQGNTGLQVTNSKGIAKPNTYYTKGNPPAMAMYRTARSIETVVADVAKEVFNT